MQSLFQSCNHHQNIAITPGSLLAFDCNQSVANLHVVGRSVVTRPAVTEICDVKRRALLCHITKFNNVQKDVDDLVQTGFLMRHVCSPLQRVWQQQRHFPIIAIDLVDCYG